MNMFTNCVISRKDENKMGLAHLKSHRLFFNRYLVIAAYS